MTFHTALQISIVSASALLAAAGAASPPPGTQAPDFVLKGLDGRNIRLSEYRGEVVVLSFWATWCGDCIAQLEKLDELRTAFGSGGLAVLAVCLDAERRSAQKALQSMELSYPVLHDAGGEVGRLYGVAAMPTTILVDRDGAVRGIYEGRPGSDAPTYADEAQKLLSEY